MIIPPVYVYNTPEQDFRQLFPILHLSRDFLTEVTEARAAEKVGEVTTVLDNGNTSTGDELAETVTPREKYRFVSVTE